MAKHPIQPLELDENKVLRFKENKIVSFLLDNGPYNMDYLARKEFSQGDREQFAQLIGYSHSGAGDLSYMSDKVLNTSEAMYKDKNTSEQESKIAYLESRLEEIKDKVRDLTVEVFDIHPDDLE